MKSKQFLNELKRDGLKKFKVETKLFPTNTIHEHFKEEFDEYYIEMKVITVDRIVDHIPIHTIEITSYVGRSTLTTFPIKTVIIKSVIIECGDGVSLLSIDEELENKIEHELFEILLQ